MMLNQYLKTIREAIGTRIFVNIYVNQYKGVLPIDAKKIWHDSLRNTKYEFKDNEYLEVAATYPEIGGGFGGTILMNIFVEERKEAA